MNFHGSDLECKILQLGQRFYECVLNLRFTIIAYTNFDKIPRRKTNYINSNLKGLYSQTESRG